MKCNRLISKLKLSATFGLYVDLRSVMSMLASTPISVFMQSQSRASYWALSTAFFTLISLSTF